LQIDNIAKIRKQYLLQALEASVIAVKQRRVDRERQKELLTTLEIRLREKAVN
jgi:hypothetical protein